MHNEREVRAVQRRQMGLITLAQLAALGVGRKVAAAQVDAGRWERPLPGVYRDTLVARSTSQAALAAVLWSGDGAVASFATAGALWGFDVEAPDRPHLWVPPTRSARSPVVVVHRGVIDPVDRRMIGPVPVTSPARTLVDLAGGLDDEDLGAAVEDAIHRGLTTPMSLGRRLAGLGGQGRPGTTRLRAVLADRGPSAAAASRLEVRIWRTLRGAGLRPTRQYRVRCGSRTYWIDAAFPEVRLGVEGVGDEFHRGTLKRRRDHARLADLAAADWRIIPVTWHAITTDPARVVTQVTRALSDPG